MLFRFKVQKCVKKRGNKFEFRDKDLVFDSENVKIVENEINLGIIH